MQAPDPGFVLNGQTLLSIGAIIGALTGTIGLLFRLLLASKDKTIEDLTIERDRYRDALLKALEQGERSASVAETALATRPKSRR